MFKSARINDLIWLGLVLGFFLFWATSLCPGLFLTDSFAVLGKVDKDAFDETFSYLYQAPLRVLHFLGLSMRAVAVTAFLSQLLMLYGLIFWIGRYLLRSSSHPLVWVPLALTLVNPVFPVMYSLHTVNTVANLIFACFVFLNYRRFRDEMRSVRSDMLLIVLGTVLVALRLDMLPSILLSFAAVLVSMRSDLKAFSMRAAVMLSSLLFFNCALPRTLDFRPSFSTYSLSLIYRPLDKILASNPRLLVDPDVTGPIEAIIRVPAKSIVGHGEEVFWWDIDRRPSPDVSWRQLSMFFRIGVENLHVVVGDRASLLVELLGSPRSFFFGDCLVLGPNSAFEPDIRNWRLREAQFRYGPWVKSLLPNLQGSWVPSEPRYWLWNELPYFLLLTLITVLYPFAPAAAFMSLLVVVRTVGLAATAPFGFYYYSTPVYLVGLLMAIPMGWLEWRSRRPNSAQSLSEGEESN